MELIEAIRQRRSIRKFKDTPLPEGAVDTILEAAKAAPSAGNVQARDFFVVANETVRKAFVEAALRQQFVGDAQVAIVVCANFDEIGKKYGERGTDLYCLQDVAAAVQNMLLTAVDLGLGACWVGAFDETAVAQALELPRNLRPVAIVPIGYTDETPERKPVRDDDVHWVR